MYRNTNINHNHNKPQTPTNGPAVDSLAAATANEYDLHFKNTNLIPETPIIKSLQNNLPTYLDEHDKPTTEKNETIVFLSHCFDLEQLNKQLSAAKKKKRFTIHVTLKGNADVVPLTKLIEFSFFESSSRFFGSAKNPDEIKSRIHEIPELIKGQLDKDISRMYYKTRLNDTDYSSQFEEIAETEEPNNPTTALKSADLFYSLLANLYSKHHIPINYDNINKLTLLTIQTFVINLNPLIVDHIAKIFEPEHILLVSTIINDTFIEITHDKQTFTVHFAINVLVSKDGAFDVDNVGGVMYYVFEADLIENTYQLSLILKYDKDNFDATKEEFDPKSDKFAAKPQHKEIISLPENMSVKNMIAVGASSAYVAATPFVLGVLGGNKKRKRKTHNKTSHNKKTRKSHNKKTRKSHNKKTRKSHNKKTRKMKN
jgi:hypothetical protein